RARREEIHDEHVEARAQQRARSRRAAHRQAAQEARAEGQAGAAGRGGRLDEVYRFHDSDIPSADGATMLVQRDGFRWIASRKSSISLRLFSTLCAVNSPPLSSRGYTSSKTFR